MEARCIYDMKNRNEKERFHKRHCYYCSEAIEGNKYKKIEMGGNGDTIYAHTKCIEKIKGKPKKKLIKRI